MTPPEEGGVGVQEAPSSTGSIRDKVRRGPGRPPGSKTRSHHGATAPRIAAAPAMPPDYLQLYGSPARALQKTMAPIYGALGVECPPPELWAELLGSGFAVLEYYTPLGASHPLIPFTTNALLVLGPLALGIWSYRNAMAQAQRPDAGKAAAEQAAPVPPGNRAAPRGGGGKGTRIGEGWTALPGSESKPPGPATQV